MKIRTRRTSVPIAILATVIGLLAAILLAGLCLWQQGRIWKAIGYAILAFAGITAQKYWQEFFDRR